MIQVKWNRSWLYIKKLDKKEINLPYRVKKNNDGIYVLPNTPYNFVYVIEKNEVEEHNKTLLQWQKEFGASDNKDRRSLMESLKTNEKRAVDDIKKLLTAKGISLWDMLYNHQIIATYLSLVNNSYGLFMEMGTGKAQPLDARILTPYGWTRMGDIKVGDEVINPEGGTSKVVGIFPQGSVETYELKTLDGGRTECSGNHLWSTRIAIRPTLGGIKTTKEVKEFVDRYKEQKPGYKQTVLLPTLTSPVEYKIPEEKLPLNPYALGVLLGDGILGKNTVNLYFWDEEILELLKEKGIEFRKPRRGGNSSGYTVTVKNTINIIRSLGLENRKSWNKFIPKMYLNGTVEQRMELLQGLLDTNGTIDKKGSVVEYSTTSIRLALEVRELARSLGAVVRIVTKKSPHYTKKDGTKVYCRDAYRVYIMHKNPSILFRVSRKRRRCNKRHYTRENQLVSRRVSEVNFIGYKECQCIKLDSENGLYVTDDYIVTHNTVVSLQVMSVRLAARQVRKALIVAPAGILRPVWMAEIESLKKRYGDPNLTYEVLDGSKEERIYKLEHSNAKVFIINYEMLSKLLPYLINADFSMIIFDESTKIKNASAQVTKAAHELAKRVRYCLILSGTPIYNREMDIHAQMNALQLNSYFHPLHVSFYAFRTTYFFKPSKSQFAPFVLKKSKSKELTRKIYSLAIGYKREECIQLPPLVTQVVPCAMNAEQSRSYEELKENVLAEIKGHKVTAQIALTKLLRLAQITAGFTNDVYGKTVRFDKNPKIDTVVELAEQIPGKIVIFCRFQETIRILKERFGKEAVTFYGEISKTEKDKAIEDFKNKTEKRIFIAQINSGGMGLNLQHASYAIFCELDYLHSTFAQAVSRIYRSGQKNKCTAYVVMCKGSIDEHLYEVINEKKESAEKILKTVMRKLESGKKELKYGT